MLHFLTHVYCRPRTGLGSPAVAPAGIPAAVAALGSSFFDHRSAVVAARRQGGGWAAADADPFEGVAVARGVNHRARRRHRFGVALGPAAGTSSDGRGRAGAAGDGHARRRPGRGRGRAASEWTGVSRAGEHHHDRGHRDQNLHIHLLGNRTSFIERSKIPAPGPGDRNRQGADPQEPPRRGRVCHRGVERVRC